MSQGIPRQCSCGKLAYTFESIEFNQKQYHKKCFCCSACKFTLTLRTANTVGSQLFCKVHYQEYLGATDVKQFHEKYNTGALSMSPTEKNKKASKVEKYEGPCFLLEMPEEVMINIVAQVKHVVEVCSLAQTCSFMSQFMKDKYIWKTLCATYLYSTTEPKMWEDFFKDTFSKEKKISVQMGDNTIKTRLDPGKTAEEIKIELCKLFGVYFHRPFSLQLNSSVLPKDQPLDAKIREQLRNGSCLKIQT